jgi:hypothetical protein
MEDGAPCGGLHKADQGAPLEAVLHWGEGPLPVETPDRVQDRLEPNAVLVDGPELDARLGEDMGEDMGEGGGDGLDKRAEVFLTASCALASACTWRGRGRRRAPPTRARDTQPTEMLTGRPSVALIQAATVRPIQ